MNSKKEFEEAFVGDMAQYLMQVGFTPDDAFKESRKFWKANRKKLENVLKY